MTLTYLPDCQPPIFSPTSNECPAMTRCQYGELLREGDSQRKSALGSVVNVDHGFFRLSSIYMRSGQCKAGFGSCRALIGCEMLIGVEIIDRKCRLAGGGVCGRAEGGDENLLGKHLLRETGLLPGGYRIRESICNLPGVRCAL